VATTAVLLALHVLVGVPAGLTPWVLGSLVLVPLGLLGGQLFCWFLSRTSNIQRIMGPPTDQVSRMPVSRVAVRVRAIRRVCAWRRH